VRLKTQSVHQNFVMRIPKVLEYFIISEVMCISIYYLQSDDSKLRSVCTDKFSLHKFGVFIFKTVCFMSCHI
jgi:hypothetical protein